MTGNKVFMMLFDLIRGGVERIDGNIDGLRLEMGVIDSSSKRLQFNKEIMLFIRDTGEVARSKELDEEEASDA